MNTIELRISLKDWGYIAIIGALFGFIISMIFYHLAPSLYDISTLYFGVISSIVIVFFSSLFITISNEYILPQVEQKLWHLISFIFSFAAGMFGFLLTFAIFSIFDTKIANFIEPYVWQLTFSIGVLTFLIGLILHQFISMKYKNEESKRVELESRLKALENELNPHFLFNALNSMSELIYVDQKKAEKAILDMSKFLRNAIDTQSLIEVQNEIQMVQTYVDIENIRFSNNIHLTVHPHKNSIELKKIPKFSIQLLVENAIKHGYMKKPLHIEVYLEDDRIIVNNDGKKFDNLKFGTGLNNLAKRLEMLDVGILKYESKNLTSFIIELKKDNH